MSSVVCVWAKASLAPARRAIDIQRKRRLKKKKERRWYDPSLPDTHEKFAMHLCFQNVMEFREALQNFHVRTLRNFEYHENEPNRVIAWCSDRKQGCEFYIVASRIAHEATFSIKKMNLDRTCGASGESTMVSQLGCQDGCFIKLSTGQKILAATGRDGNNNIFPIAFGVVDKEETDSWTWFLTQLRTIIGNGNKFGKYQIMCER
ncbi:MATE efflux family protein 3, chloroplastic [Hordeum vulgare]|nr:MATE efflux family protein 3, chloroplastic [Hordeum vulgare]